MQQHNGAHHETERNRETPPAWAQWWRAPLSTAGSPPFHAACCWQAESAAPSRADPALVHSLWHWPSDSERSSLRHKHEGAVEFLILLLNNNLHCDTLQLESGKKPSSSVYNFVLIKFCIAAPGIAVVFLCKVPVLLGSNSWKALMRSDLCTNSCSLRACRADLSVHPTLPKNR